MAGQEKPLFTPTQRAKSHNLIRYDETIYKA